MEAPTAAEIPEWASGLKWHLVVDLIDLTTTLIYTIAYGVCVDKSKQIGFFVFNGLAFCFEMALIVASISIGKYRGIKSAGAICEKDKGCADIVGRSRQLEKDANDLQSKADQEKGHYVVDRVFFDDCVVDHPIFHAPDTRDMLKQRDIKLEEKKKAMASLAKRKEVIHKESVAKQRAGTYALFTSTWDILYVILCGALAETFETDDCGVADTVLFWLNLSVSIINFLFLKGPELYRWWMYEE